LVSDIPAGDGKNDRPFLQCNVVYLLPIFGADYMYLSGARHILHLLGDYGSGLPRLSAACASKQIFFSPSIKKSSYFIFFRQELMSQCSIFTVPGDNNN
jgi:hypothetical protein